MNTSTQFISLIAFFVLLHSPLAALHTYGSDDYSTILKHRLKLESTSDRSERPKNLLLKFDPVFNMGIRSFQAAHQDDKGFLWIGSGDGLFRWDGYNLRNYGIEAGLSATTVSWIVQDTVNHDIFWIGTYGGGLSRFDLNSETFINYLHDPKNPKGIATDTINSLLQDGQDPDILWIAGDTHFQQFRKSTGVFKRYIHDVNPAIPKNMQIWRLIEDSEDSNVLWMLAYGSGLYRFDKKAVTFNQYSHDPEDSQSLAVKNGILGYIAQDRDDPDILWIGGFSQPILEKFNKTEESFTHYTHDVSDSGSLPQGGVRFIYDDGRGNLWLAGWTYNNGLTLFDKSSETFTNYKSNPGSPRGLSNDNVVNVYEDRSGIFWIMTYTGEVLKYDPYTQNFNFFQNNPLDTNSLINNNINGLYEDSEEIMWFSTGGGLSRYNRETGNFTNYTHDPGNPESLDQDDIHVCYEDSEGHFWISGRSGTLMNFDKKHGKVRMRYKTPRGITKIVEDKQNPDILWLGAWRIPFMKFNKNLGTFKTYPLDAGMSGRGPNKPNMFSAINDQDDRFIWLGSRHGGGLNRFDKNTERFHYYMSSPDNPTSISNDVITSIYQDQTGILWIGTEGSGLNKFDKNTDIFTHYGSQFNIPYNVECILEDNHGKLWLSTTEGILSFNPQTEKVETHYRQADGLQGDRFRDGCCGKTRSGELWFGGTNGANSFHPDSLTTNNHVPRLVLISLTQAGESITQGKSPTRTDNIILNWNRSFFEFEYTALNFTSPKKNQYKYKLEGWDTTWYDAVSERKGRYSGLSIGDYTLRIIGSNNDGVWNNEGVSLKVTVVPPFWLKWWAYVIYCIIGAGLVFGSIYMRVRSQNQKLAQKNNELVQERLLTARLHQLDQLKDEFLANSSHELRTPLHGIFGLTKSLISGVAGNLPEPALKNLRMIISVTGQLMNLVNDILDFSKLKYHDINLKLEAVDIRPAVDLVLALLEPLRGQKDLHMINEVPVDLPLVVADEERLQQILYNLVGNALKFTDRGKITVSATLTGIDKPKFVAVSVTDTGIGIPAPLQKQIFESFTQADGTLERGYGGTGLGLSITRQLIHLHGGEIELNSTEGKGSTFTFNIPVISDQLAPMKKKADTSSQADKETVSKFIPNKTSEMNISRQDPTESDQLNQKHVLAVDDNPVNLQIVNNFLSLKKYRVSLCGSGKEALAAVENEKPDLVLLDVMMPRMSGFEVSRKLRNMYSLSELPILMLTVRDKTLDLVNGFKAGANDYLTKPFDEEELLVRVDALLKLQNTEMALRESETRFRELADSITDIFFALDSDLKYTYWNRASENLSRIMAKDALGKSFYEINHWLTGDAIEKLYLEVQKYQKPRHVYHNHEIAGSEMNFEINVYPAINGLAVVAKDITARKQAESEKLKLEDHLRQAQKLEALGTLAGGIAHDFNNILTAIIGYSELALEASSHNQIATDEINEIMIAGQRARDLVRQILVFSRFSEQKNVPVQFSMIIKEAMKLLRASLPSTIEIQTEITSDAHKESVFADPSQLHRILMNLCTNAAHAMWEKGGNLGVRLSKTQLDSDFCSRYPEMPPGSFLCLSVSDTGHGMSESIQQRIFEPYFTTKSDDGGSGLGLATVYGIVTGYQGAISVESEPGQGTDVQVFLPIIKKTVTKERENTLRITGHGRVLVVEDEDAILKMEHKFLEILGYEVVAVKSSVEALKNFRNAPENFDIIITDQTMPMMTGTELAREIFKIRPDMSVILCTGYSDTVDSKKAHSMGIKKFLLKPITIAQLSKALSELKP